MKKIIVKGFEDKVAEHIYGKRINAHALGYYTENSMLREVVTNLGTTDETVLNERQLGRTMYIPPVHMRTFNGSEYVLLMPWINIINGIYDKRNLPWLQHVQSSGIEDPTLARQIIYVLQNTLEQLMEYRDVHNAMLPLYMKDKFNRVVSGVNDSLVPSWILSTLLFYNPLMHSKLFRSLEYFYNVKDVTKFGFTMGGRKIDTMYRGVRSAGTHTVQFYNSLDMFITTSMGNFNYDDNMTNSGNRQSKFELDPAYYGRFVEFGAARDGQRMYRRGTIRLTDEAQIVPLITPVIKMGDLFDVLGSMFSADPLSVAKPVINRDLIKFNAYLKPLTTFSPISVAENSVSRIKVSMDRNLKKLSLAGCNINYIDNVTEETNYLGGLANMSPLPTTLKAKDGHLQVYTLINKVALDSIKSVSGPSSLAGKLYNESVSNVEIIDWLLKFGDTHIPLLNRT